MNEAAKLCAQLRLPPAPLVIVGLETTLGFFRQQLRLDPLRWVEAFRQIDFLHAVRVEVLTPRTRLAPCVFPDRDAPDNLPYAFFTTPSTAPEDAALSLWEVPDKIRVLASQATTLPLGGRQYLLSREHAQRLVKIETSDSFETQDANDETNP